jgi:hypothetical protein
MTIVRARKPKHRTAALALDSSSAKPKPIATIVQARAPNKLHKDHYDAPDHAELMRRGEKAKEVWRMIVERAGQNPIPPKPARNIRLPGA